MSDDTSKVADRKLREAKLVFARIKELAETPVQGSFDVSHLKSVHAYIFQDLHDHRPGIVRGDTDRWIKQRVLEGRLGGHVVDYAHDRIEKRIAGTLRDFGGPAALKGLTLEIAAGKLAKLYGDLDFAHGFYEGNSRTLREFTRDLAGRAGYKLDWTGTAVDQKERNALYMARDVEVLKRAFPELTPQRAMQTKDRTEYEASFALTRLREEMGEATLETIICDKLTIERTAEIYQHAPGDQTERHGPVAGQAASRLADADRDRSTLAAEERKAWAGEIRKSRERRERTLANDPDRDIEL